MALYPPKPEIKPEKKKEKPPVCPHFWEFVPTPWEGVQDRRCRRCGSMDIAVLSDKQFNEERSKWPQK